MLNNDDKNLVPFSNWDKEFDNIFGSMKEHMLNLFNSRGNFLNFAEGSSFPKTNVRTKGKDLILEVAVPEYPADDLDVSLVDGTLSISGKAIQDDSTNDEYMFREVKKSAFTRSWRIPDNITDSDISVNYDRGVLLVTIKGANPKFSEQEKVKKIPIQFKKRTDK